MKRTDRVRAYIRVLAHLVLAVAMPGGYAADTRDNTDWFRDAGFGVFMHLLPSDTQGLQRVRDFDVEALTKEATNQAFIVIEEYLRELKCKSQK